MNNTIKTLTYGVEIETLGQTREKVARAIHSVTGGSITHGTDYYDSYYVKMADGRKWQVMSDSSINAPRNLQAEVVTPILKYEDMETLQKVVRAIRRCGAKVDSSCGMHVHVGAQPFTTKALVNLVKLTNKHEAHIMAALDVKESRQRQWCKSINAEFLAKLAADRPRNLDELNTAWYGRYNPRPQHYDGTRYHGLNFHNVWYRGTVEYRYANATLHAGKVKATVQFFLALSAKALASKGASAKKRDFNAATAKYDFRVFLLNLGMKGDEFATARLHLLAKLDGNISWRRAA